MDQEEQDRARRGSMEAQKLMEEHTKSKNDNNKHSGNVSTISQTGKPVPTHLLIIKAEDGKGLQTKTIKGAAAGTQTSNPSFEYHSVGVRSRKSNENVASTSQSPERPG